MPVDSPTSQMTPPNERHSDCRILEDTARDNSDEHHEVMAGLRPRRTI